MSTIISGIGVYYPQEILTNAKLETMVDTSDEWISTRTGIKERRILAKDSLLQPSDLGVEAAKIVFDKTNFSPENLDGIICTGIVADKSFPATACFIQQKIKAKGFAFDVIAACAGFVYALNLAHSMINSGQCKNILIVATEMLSKVVDWSDRNTCILFGDAAGAALVSHSDDHNRGLIASKLESKGSEANILRLNSPNSYLQMEGPKVFKRAVSSLSEIVCNICSEHNLKIDQLHLVLFHQANIRILEAVQAKLGLENSQLLVNIQRFGNTSSASIPLLLQDAEDQNLLIPGKLMVLSAIGGGMSWGCNLLRW